MHLANEVPQEMGDLAARNYMEEGEREVGRLQVGQNHLQLRGLSNEFECWGTLQPTAKELF
jgi:hypothetical protein